MYGLQKIATEHLKQFARGLRSYSHRHVRLRVFRAVSGLVPGDPLCSLAAAEFQVRALELQSRHVANGAVPLDTRSAVTLFLALCRTNRLDAATTMLANLEHVNPPPAEAEAVAAVEAALATGDAAASPDEPMWHAMSTEGW